MTKKKRVKRQQKIVWGIVGVVVIILLAVVAGYSTELRTQLVPLEVGQGPGACYGTVVGACTQVPVKGKCPGPDKYFWAGQDCREDVWLLNHTITTEVSCFSEPAKTAAKELCLQAFGIYVAQLQDKSDLCLPGYAVGVVSNVSEPVMTPLTEELDSQCRVTCGALVTCQRAGPGYIGDIRPAPLEIPI